MAISPIKESFKGSGHVLLDIFDADGNPTGVYHQFGNCTSLTLTPQSETETRESNYPESYGEELESITQKRPTKFKMTGNDVPRKVLALAVFGKDVDFEQEAATEDQTLAVTPTPGTVTLLPHVNILAAGLAIAPSVGDALDLGMDYEVDLKGGAVKWLETAKVTGQLTITYRHGATEGYAITIGTEAQIKGALRLNGKNHTNGKACILDIWGASFSPTTELDLMGKSFLSPTFEGQIQVMPGHDEPALLRSF